MATAVLISEDELLQVHDRMTEQVYPTPLRSFKTDTVPTPVFTVPIMSQGAAALEQINEVGSCHVVSPLPALALYLCINAGGYHPSAFLMIDALHHRLSDGAHWHVQRGIQ